MLRRKKYHVLQKCTVFGTIALLLTAGAGCLVQYVPVLSRAMSEKLNPEQDQDFSLEFDQDLKQDSNQDSGLSGFYELSELSEEELEHMPDLLQPDFYLSQGFGISEDSENSGSDSDSQKQSVFSEQKTEKSEKKSDPGAKPYPEEWDPTGGIVEQMNYGFYSGTRFFQLRNAGQVQNKTALSNQALYAESQLLPEFQIAFDGTPQVLIMHTHTTESFEPYERETYDSSFNYRTTDSSKNMIMVGDAIAQQLEQAGIGVIHDTTIHDYPSYTGSYERSAVTVQNALIQYPSIKIVLDIHRDAIGGDGVIKQPVAEIDGRKASQVMIISGCDDGTMDMPEYLKNFRFACLLQQQMEADYPGFTRPILFDYRKYNQNLTTGSILIEVGSHGNTLDQVEYAGELIGSSLARALESIQQSEEE
ncbi:MAG: stage II sporulation protein P [Oscillospiraceae bacterium]|nr:stage II sporulation protein P [Oscillospiraceae bacterium]MDE5884346.1 stage II sporulation protein P [Oscillospiraceae bacterium]